MITAENLTKSFGSQTLFDRAGFKLNARERLGLVGRNGHGKTTLFRIIAGEEQPDSGTVTIPRHYRIGYIRQKLDFKRNTVLEEGMTGLLEHEKDHYWKVEKILAGLGFSGTDMQRHPLDFSGGYQVRLNLAKVLINEPDLLLLDEPTNYLDINAIRWIESYLNGWPHEVMLITHDRSFMDAVATHIIGIHRKKLRKIRGNTEKYYSQIARDEEIYEKTRIKDERRRREIDQFIRRFRAKARLANLVQSRIKLLAKTTQHEKLEKIKSLDFSFRSLPFSGKYLVNSRDISFGYDGRHPVIEDFDLTVSRGDRIGVIGKNGQGKTTLLKLLAGVLQPQQGRIRYNPNVIMGFYEQTNIKSLSDERTVEQEILYSNPSMDKQAARNICGAMMFSGEDALKKISVLSGGEKSRVMLGKILATPVNLLLLDEPTNHLDMESCDALLAALDCFDGTVVVVTHNEMFLHALANRLVVFQNKRIAVYEGSYQHFLDKGGWDEAPVGVDSLEKERPPGSGKLNKKEIRRRRSEIITEKNKVLKPLKQKMTAIEGEIDRWDQALSKLNQEMQTATETRESQRIAEISQAIHHGHTSIDRLFEKLESVTRAYDEKKALFEKTLRQLNSDREA
jgi:ATP-binding cassette subfamily F protein 3